MEAKTQEILQNELKVKRICRFCLCQNTTKLSNIYMRDTRIKTSAPLPIQIMAIASIEVSYLKKTILIKFYSFYYQFVVILGWASCLANTNFILYIFCSLFLWSYGFLYRLTYTLLGI